jgi:hypothetical protein
MKMCKIPEKYTPLGTAGINADTPDAQLEVTTKCTIEEVKALASEIGFDAENKKLQTIEESGFRYHYRILGKKPRLSATRIDNENKVAYIVGAN